MEGQQIDEESTAVVPSILPRLKRKAKTRVPWHLNEYETQRSNNIDVLALSASSSSSKTDDQVQRPNFQNQTELFISSIPKRLNTTSSLEKHFSKFGNIISIITCYENDSKSALIRFAQPSEATAAFRSTEPVLNNRFIKVLWAHKVNARSNRGNERDTKKEGSNDTEIVDKRNSNNNSNFSCGLVLPDKENRSKFKDKRHYPVSKKTDPKLLRNLSEKYTFLQESVLNQKLLLKKLEVAKTAKEKHSIKKLLRAINEDQRKNKAKETFWLRNPNQNYSWISMDRREENHYDESINDISIVENDCSAVKYDELNEQLNKNNGTTPHSSSSLRVIDEMQTTSIDHNSKFDRLAEMEEDFDSDDE